MSFRNILIAGVAALTLGSLCARAEAQVTVLPQVPAIVAGDLFQDIQNGVAKSTNVYASSLQLRSYMIGQSAGHTGVPTLTTSTTVCGGAAGTVNGTDVSGQITQGSSASTSCVVTFATPFVTAPECFVSINNVADTVLKCATSTTALTITSGSQTAQLINYQVVGLPGG